MAELEPIPRYFKVYEDDRRNVHPDATKLPKRDPIFEQARRTLEMMEREELRVDRTTYHRERRRELREALVPRDRKCSVCREVKLGRSLCLAYRSDLTGVATAEANKCRDASREGVFAVCVSCKRTHFRHVDFARVR